MGRRKSKLWEQAESEVGTSYGDLLLGSTGPEGNETGCGLFRQEGRKSILVYSFPYSQYGYPNHRKDPALEAAGRKQRSLGREDTLPKIKARYEELLEQLPQIPVDTSLVGELEVFLAEIEDIESSLWEYALEETEEHRDAIYADFSRDWDGEDGMGTWSVEDATKSGSERCLWSQDCNHKSYDDARVAAETLVPLLQNKVTLDYVRVFLGYDPSEPSVPRR
jgi:hypothetical protein